MKHMKYKIKEVWNYKNSGGSVHIQLSSFHTADVTMTSNSAYTVNESFSPCVQTNN
jgi:hypothetical protein